MANMQFTVDDEQHIEYKKLPRYKRLFITEQLRKTWEDEMRKHTTS